MAQVVKLSELERGEEGMIYSIEEGPITLKLLEMGCIPGEKITIENVAPFGDPIAVSVTGYKLSLRLEEASFISVEPLGIVKIIGAENRKK